VELEGLFPDKSTGRARSTSDPPNLRVSLHKNESKHAQNPTVTKKHKTALTVVTPASPITSPLPSPTQPPPPAGAVLTPIVTRSPSTAKLLTGWSQMAADMEQELEELTGLINADKPTTPKPLYDIILSSSLCSLLPITRTRSTSKNQNQFSLDNMFAKKGQQYLTPILQKSRQAAQNQPGIVLGLSGKSL